MRRISQLIFTACATAAMAFGPDCDACTNVLVTKGASADGSNIISYAADSHQLFGELYRSLEQRRHAPNQRMGQREIPRGDSAGIQDMAARRQHE